jgi:hypothetical protein
MSWTINPNRGGMADYEVGSPYFYRGFKIDLVGPGMLYGIFQDDHRHQSMGAYTTIKLAQNAIDRHLEGTLQKSWSTRKRNKEDDMGKE